MPRAPKTAPQEAVDVDALLATYRAWLGRQALATRSREAYAAQVAAFLAWLASSEPRGVARRTATCGRRGRAGGVCRPDRAAAGEAVGRRRRPRLGVRMPA